MKGFMDVRPLLHGKTFAAMLAGMALAFGSVGFSQNLAFSNAVSGHAVSSNATNGIESAIASVPATSATAVYKQPTLQIAQRSRVRRIQFEPGASSAILKDAVVRGTQDIYLVGASKGQTMTLKIASLENNGVFQLLTPANSAGQRRSLTVEAMSWAGGLPASGDYQIIVGSTRGNASYQLKVGIR